MKLKKMIKHKSSSIPLKKIDLDYVNNPELIKGLNINEEDIKGSIVKINATILERDVHKVNFATVENAYKEHAIDVFPVIPRVIKEKTTLTKNKNNRITPYERAIKKIEESTLRDDLKEEAKEYAKDLFR